MRILIVGHGRMGKMIESLAPEYGAKVAGVVDIADAPAMANGADPGWGHVDVAVDFTLPEAVPVNLPALAHLGINVVIGTTGWYTHEASLQRVVERAGTGVVTAPNFSAAMV